MNLPESAPSRREPGNGGKKMDAAPTRRQRRRSHVAASDINAAAVLPSPCIPSLNMI